MAQMCLLVPFLSMPAYIRTHDFLLTNWNRAIHAWCLTLIEIQCRIWILIHSDWKLFSELYTFSNVIAFDTQIKVNFNTNYQFSSHLSSPRLCISLISMQTMYRTASKSKSCNTLYFYEPQRISPKKANEMKMNRNINIYLALHESIWKRLKFACAWFWVYATMQDAVHKHSYNRCDM